MRNWVQNKSRRDNDGTVQNLPKTSTHQIPRPKKCKGRLINSFVHSKGKLQNGQEKEEEKSQREERW